MRLIDAKEVEMQIKNGMAESPVVMGMMLRWIRKQPTIDAEPVVHGRWTKRYEGLFDCSSCGVRMDLEGTPEEYLMHYCPNCGAKMDEVSERINR